MTEQVGRESGRYSTSRNPTAQDGEQRKTFTRPFTDQELGVPPVNIQGPFMSSALPHELPPPREWGNGDRTSISSKQMLEKDDKIPIAEVDLGSSDNHTAPKLPTQADWERVKAWQDERLQRRLRGEYEDAQAKLASTAESQRTANVRLDTIRVEGAVHTRPSFLQGVFKPCLDQQLPSSAIERLAQRLLPSLPPAPKPDSLDSTIESVHYLTSALAAHGIFSSITPTLGPSWNPFSTSEDVALTLKVREASRYLLKTSTDFGNGEGSARITGRLRNAFGGAETIEGEFGGGTRSSNNFQLKFETPILANYLARFEASVFGTTRNNQWYASHDERLHGARLMYKALSGSTLHQFAYDLHWRKVYHLSSIVSQTIRREAGDNIKSALSHTMIKDNRDDRLMPTRGTLFKTTTELADLGGDASFFKIEAEGQIAVPLRDRFHMTATCQVGGMSPLRSGPGAIICSDRFLLGGSNSVRGFRTNAIGPRDRVDYIGGDAFWASGLSLFTPIPGVPKHWDMRAHYFVNAGRLINLGHSKSHTALQNLLRQPSVSAGFGIMYRHPAARIELNVVMPIAASRSDSVRKGIEVGIGASFL